MPDLIDRFGLAIPYSEEDRGHTDPCWVFSGRAEARGGYGQLRRRGRNHIAHRVSYETLVGEIPRGLELDHLCRVRRCIRPTHLEPVTSSINTRRGDLAKLTYDAALEIRLRYPGESQAALARTYGVSRAAIRQVLNGVTWITP